MSRMKVKIEPRKLTDRGGVACMPLLRNVPVGRSDWKLTTCPVCGAQCWETPLLVVAKAQGAAAFCTMCALKAGVQYDKSEQEEQYKFPYVEGQGAEIFHDGRWKKGKIIAGYRFRDGIVTVLTDDGEKIWCGVERKELYRAI